MAGAVALVPLPSHAQGAAPDAWLLSLCLTARPPVAPEGLWQAWSFAPVFVVPLALVLGLYGWTLARQGRRESGMTMGPALFIGGWLLLAIALVSPLCRMAAALASAHMVQHVILVALAPPLLVLGAWSRIPGLSAAGSPAAGLPVDTRATATRNHVLRMLSWPTAVSILYAVVIWASHVPLIYQAALKDATTHVVVTYGLVAVSVMFWRTVIDAALNPRASSGGPALLAIFFAMVQTSLLGALLALSPTTWYPVFDGSVAIWGLTPLEDQQLAGLIMWVPMGAIYLTTGLIVTMIVVFGRVRSGWA
jgi:cytochrome c oxidase assembly factor CtaG